MSADPLPVTVFTDIICPFCYVGHRRLARVREQVPLAVTWRFLEIHPETPPDGMPVEMLGYPPDLWSRMVMHLGNLAAEEGIALTERHITTNSHKALLVAEAAKALGEARFEEVVERLFFAFFTEGRNIGRTEVLAKVAREAGLPEEVFERALIEPAFEELLRENRVEASRHRVRGVPAFVFGADPARLVSGAVPLSHLVLAAREAAGAV
jgi:predicted DsbA family dithiol-disulfide isomerase